MTRLIQRFVTPQLAREVIAAISGGDLTEEAGFRLLFPEEADVIYGPLPCNPPAAGGLGDWKGGTNYKGDGSPWKGGVA